MRQRAKPILKQARERKKNMYSSDKFIDEWVYAIDKDFKSPDGTPATYATGQPASFGDEVAKIELASTSNASSLNADGTLLAVEQGHNIHISRIIISPLDVRSSLCDHKRNTLLEIDLCGAEIVSNMQV